MPKAPAYPDAQIFSFDGGEIHQISYRESQPFQLVSGFVAAPERYINALFFRRSDLMRLIEQRDIEQLNNAPKR